MMVTSAQVIRWPLGGGGGGGGVVNLHLVKYGDIGLGDPWHLLWYWRVIYKDKKNWLKQKVLSPAIWKINFPIVCVRVTIFKMP